MSSLTIVVTHCIDIQMNIVVMAGAVIELDRRRLSNFPDGYLAQSARTSISSTTRKKFNFACLLLFKLCR
jgi:hypothetical protein